MKDGLPRGGAALVRVQYAVFESDLPELDRAAQGEDHEIDGEVRFEFADGTARAVSWCDKPIAYCVGVSDGSFFQALPFVVDGSRFPVWAPLLEKAIVFAFADPDHQVLRAGGGAACAYLASRDKEHWGVDVLHITVDPQLPGSRLV